MGLQNILRVIRRYDLPTLMSYSLNELGRLLYRNPIRHSYSQDYEDNLLDYLLGYKKTGFYVDIGAYDPKKMSNTKRFYDRGWTGINIEPSPTRFSLFPLFRPRDMNLNIGLGSKNETLTFYDFDPPTLSTFSEEHAKSYQNQGFTLVSTNKVKVKRLSEILSTYSEITDIDFLTIDSEGLDLEILEGNDWKKFRPILICIELNQPGFEGYSHQEAFFKKHKYELVAATLHNAIYRNKR